MSVVATVIAKEARDNARDKRAASTALLMPLMGPLSLVLLFFAFSDIKEKQEAPKVPVIGKEHAPVLVDMLVRSGVVVEEAPADPEQAVKNGKVDIVLVIPATFGDDLRAGRPAVVEVIADESRQASSVIVDRVKATLRQYGGQLGSLRLVARGVDPLVVQAISISTRDVGTPQGKTALLLGVMPLFLLMACFMGGTYVAIDVTAGERERGSLEALLLNPVRARDLVVGKVVVAALFGLLGVCVAALGFVVAVAVIPFKDTGLDLRLSPLLACALVALLVPVVALGASVQVFVGTLCKTFKTAQAAISVVMLAPTLPGALLMMFPQQPTTTMMLVPTLGHSILMMRLLRGEPVAAADVAVASVAVLAVAAALLAITTRLFGPRLITGR
jgi:sodium transport system permease protein